MKVGDIPSLLVIKTSVLLLSALYVCILNFLERIKIIKHIAHHAPIKAFLVVSLSSLSYLAGLAL
jgi:hypothetical protein